MKYLLFCLSLLFVCAMQLPLAKVTDLNYDTYFFSFFYRDTREFISDLLWLKVDQYHHAAATDPAEIISLCRIVADLNPSRLDAFIVGSFQLLSFMGDLAGAEDFLNQGIAANQNNPDLDKLYSELGNLQFLYQNDLDHAKLNFRTALELYPQRNDPGTFYIPENYLRMLYFISCLLKDNDVEKFAGLLKKAGINPIPINEISQNYDQIELIIKNQLRADHEKLLASTNGIEGNDTLEDQLAMQEESHGIESGPDSSLHGIAPAPFEVPEYQIEMLLKSGILIFLSGILAVIKKSC
ncbi:MAG: hypothetical protein PHW04_08165 [Candidatus Wallbacteria bacterium]|nr:hypothetical protein [Candidatus Wallbacteria bacterium]